MQDIYPYKNIIELNNSSESKDIFVDVSAKDAPVTSESISQSNLTNENEASTTTKMPGMTSVSMSNKDGSILSGQSTLDPTQTGLSIGFQLTSDLNETEFRDESAIANSAQQCDVKSLPRPEESENEFSAASHPREELSRPVSKTEFTDAMLTENALPDSVPAFPSWSLLCLGPASLYNPQKGIEQQGFFSGSNYLLPWEIRLSDSAMAIIQEETIHGTKDSNEEQWPAPGEASKSTASTVSGPGVHLPIFQTISKLRLLQKELDGKELFETAGKATPVKQQKGGKDDKVKAPSIKAHIGNEYECPRGHR